MSTTYAIACPETKKMLWIGQRNFIYTSESDTMELLESFLYEHVGKPLVFDRDDEMDGYENYTHPTLRAVDPPSALVSVGDSINSAGK